ncbi:MAG: GntR family transcriptional regulator [Alphaproteobacteria bacterium]|nr:GntR family transcriptional regulator [Alphaproteobacteria bacterium]
MVRSATVRVRDAAKRMVAAGGRRPKRRLKPEEVANGIVERTARGFYQPGQRLIETDVAATLGVSRLPLREALKTLESQGIVVSTPHRGTRLMEVNETRLKHVNDVRVELELLALKSALPAFRDHPALLRRLDTIINDMKNALRRGDRYAIARHDVSFHRALCVASGNDVLVTLWDALQRQLTILFGLPWLGHPDMESYLAEHRELRRVFGAGDLPAARKALVRHILVGWRAPKA